jgi:hypothetical protein
MLSEHFAEASAKLLASQLSRLWLSFPAHKLKLIGSAPAEAFNLQCQMAMVIGIDADYASNQRAFLRPQMKQRGACLFAYLVLKIFKRCEPGTVFLHFDGSARQQARERFLEGLIELHGGKV